MNPVYYSGRQPTCPKPDYRASWGVAFRIPFFQAGSSTPAVPGAKSILPIEKKAVAQFVRVMPAGDSAGEYLYLPVVRHQERAVERVLWYSPVAHLWIWVHLFGIKGIFHSYYRIEHCRSAGCARNMYTVLPRNLSSIWRYRERTSTIRYFPLYGTLLVTFRQAA